MKRRLDAIPEPPFKTPKPRHPRQNPHDPAGVFPRPKKEVKAHEAGGPRRRRPVYPINMWDDRDPHRRKKKKEKPQAGAKPAGAMRKFLNKIRFSKRNGGKSKNFS